MIVAEIGISHRGDMNRAKELIRLAKENGADLVKSQLFDAEDDKDKPYYQESKAGELTYDQAKELFDYAESIGIEMFYSVFGVKYVEWCERIGVKRYKLAAGMIEDFRVWDAVRQTRKSIIASVRDANCHTDYKPMAFLWCPAGYPTVMPTMPIFSGVGFSDHCIGIDYARIALARGAKIVEKHFASSHNATTDGVDAPWSMDVLELRELKRWADLCKEVIG